MARRRSGVIDDLLVITAKLPWWFGVVAATVSFFLMSSLAAGNTDGTNPVKVLMSTFARLAMYVLPLVFLVGAVMSALGMRKRQGLLAAAGADGASAIAGMGWAEFEMLVGESFRSQGYRVKENDGGGADGGIDLVLSRDGQTSLVQCKHWKVYSVGVPIVREMLGLMTAHSATTGWIITSGKFTAEAQQFAKGKAITLVDGIGLAELIHRARATGTVPSAAVRSAARDSRSTGSTPQPTPARRPEPTPESSVPVCPRCDLAMVRRTAAKGAMAGQWFWGCSGFPACRGTRPYE